MNSLNILSGRASPSQSTAPSRSNSYGNLLSPTPGGNVRRDSADNASGSEIDEKEEKENTRELDYDEHADANIHEEIPLLREAHVAWSSAGNGVWAVFYESIRIVLSFITKPVFFFVGWTYDEEGNFAPLSSIARLGAYFGRSHRTSMNDTSAATDEDGLEGGGSWNKELGRRGSKKALAASSLAPSISSSSDTENERSREMPGASASRHARSKSHGADEIAPARRSIRIKLHNEDNSKQRKHRKAMSTSSQSNGSGAITAATLKSPTSPAASLLLTKYPRAPAPPRPLIPRRQPSFTTLDAPSGPQKTLILDLDETLIHSMSKGTRMGQGHMVEVKLNTVGAGGAPLGPQHPILYYVYKRPHCDDFLRRISKWYNLVIFTASVQEYADPVIDWLEQERRFFSGRYYRQHCTYRGGAFIKDLSSVEPDLSKVMILDNSPLSYMFHQDNAIPIEGWISDPTDNDLLHLVPLLEGLQYVTDVRAFLALRGGEDGKHMVT